MAHSIDVSQNFFRATPGFAQWTCKYSGPQAGMGRIHGVNNKPFCSPRLIWPTPLLSHLPANSSALSPGYGLISQSNPSTTWWQIDYCGRSVVWPYCYECLLWVWICISVHHVSANTTMCASTKCLFNEFTSYIVLILIKGLIYIKKVRQLANNYGLTGLTCYLLYSIIFHLAD